MTGAQDSDRRIEIWDELTPQATKAVLELLDEATRADQRPPVSEQGRLELRRPPQPHVRHLVLRQGTAVAGYAQLAGEGAEEPPTGELVVHPEYRGRGHGTALTRALLDASGGRLRLWAHGGHPAARHIAGSLGLSLVRELRQMRRPLTGDEAPGLPEAKLPDGVRVRTFVPGQDEDAWLALNAAAFAHHPEQGGWTAADLRARMAEEWFDPAGFFLATRESEGAARSASLGGRWRETGGPLVGFHWTKVHAKERLGEIYVLGVHPAEQGTGLGQALATTGLRHLAHLGLPAAMLYVDADNASALRVYQRLGFAIHEVDLMYLWRA